VIIASDMRCTQAFAGNGLKYKLRNLKGWLVRSLSGHWLANNASDHMGGCELRKGRVMGKSQNLRL